MAPHTVMNRRFLSHLAKIILALGITTISYEIAEAMDWDTAAEVAVCTNHGDYEELGARTRALLSDHKIDSMLMYFEKPDKFGGEGLTTDPKQAGRWGVYVHIRNANVARKLIADAVKHGLPVTLSTKDPEESDMRCNVRVATATVSQNHKPPKDVLKLQTLLRDKGIKSVLSLLDRGPDLKGRTVTNWFVTVYPEDAERARRFVGEAQARGLRVEPSLSDSDGVSR
jgi:hypothetical protein